MTKILIDKETLSLALEALNTPRPEDSYPPLWRAYKATIDSAITALRQALEQSTEQEPDFKKAYLVWQEKTEWVQETAQLHELGMHRADVLRQRIEQSTEQEPVAAIQLLNRLERNWHRMGELWERCQGKGWPTAESDEFTELRDDKAPANRKALLDLYTSPPQRQSVDNESDNG